MPTDDLEYVSGCGFICEVPSALGRVTKLEIRGGKLVAETESGIDFIAPFDPEKLGESS